MGGNGVPLCSAHRTGGDTIIVLMERDGNFLSFFQKQVVPPQLAANCDYIDAQESLRAKVSVSVESSDSLSPMLLKNS